MASIFLHHNPQFAVPSSTVVRPIQVRFRTDPIKNIYLIIYQYVYVNLFNIICTVSSVTVFVVITILMFYSKTLTFCIKSLRRAFVWQFLFISPMREVTHTALNNVNIRYQHSLHYIVVGFNLINYHLIQIEYLIKSLRGRGQVPFFLSTFHVISFLSRRLKRHDIENSKRCLCTKIGQSPNDITDNISRYVKKVHNLIHVVDHPGSEKITLHFLFSIQKYNSVQLYLEVIPRDSHVTTVAYTIRLLRDEMASKEGQLVVARYHQLRYENDSLLMILI